MSPSAATAAPPTKLIGVLRKPTRSTKTSPTTNSTTASPSSSNHNSIPSITPGEEKLHSAIQQLRIRDGDEGYRKTNSKMMNRGNSNGRNSTGSSTNTNTSIASGQSDSSSSSSIQECHDSWRKDGRERRRETLEEDALNGGSDFHINHQSPLRTYSAIADRVRDQFQQAYSSPGTSTSELQSIYIMGNRLINFLAMVLPTHHHYHSKRPEHTRLRVKITHDLVLVRHQVEDVALNLDKEFYKHQHMNMNMNMDMDMQMEGMMEGMEFLHDSPRNSRRKERVRKVKFNLGSEPSLDQLDGDESKAKASLSGGAKMNSNVPLNRGEEDAMDLAVWGERDPGFGDLSFSSDEISSSFDSSFSILQEVQDEEVEGSGSFDFDIGCEGKGGEEKIIVSLEDEVLDVFGGMDDGWEHYDANKASDEIMEWPEMSGAFPTTSKTDDVFDGESNQDTTGSTANTSNENDDDNENDALNQSSIVADDDSTSSQESGSSGDSDQFVDHSFESEFCESFVEKICRENFCSAIDELQDNDDDSAQDSWAQSQQSDILIANRGTHETGPQCIPLRKESVVVNHDELESSIDGGHQEINLSIQELAVDQAPQNTPELDALPRAEDILKLLHGDQSMDYSNESHSSLEFSYSSSKIISENYLSSSAEDCDNTDDNLSVVLDLHEDFDSSQIIAESPSFEPQSEEENDDSEHDEFIRSLTEEFSDHSDSSGASKTFVTASTVDETVDEHSFRGSFERDAHTSEDSVLGISRRDTYIPTIDSPRSSRKAPRKQLGDELDYLESKVKNLQVQHTKDASQRTGEEALPLQRARDTQRIQSPTPEKDTNEPACPTSSIDIPTDEKVEKPKVASNFSLTRRHPTAARLKVLRQSSAWKRRYGKAGKE